MAALRIISFTYTQQGNVLQVCRLLQQTPSAYKTDSTFTFYHPSLYTPQEGEVYQNLQCTLCWSLVFKRHMS